MRLDNLEVLAPHLQEENFNEAEVLGSVVWLWIHSDAHRNLPLHKLPSLLLPAIKSRQFVLVSESGKPLFYLAWARLNKEAENRYLNSPLQGIPEDDWTCGERLWLIDWVAPFANSQRLRELLKRRLFPGWCARSLYCCGSDLEPRVISFHGAAVTPEEARFWFENNPPAFQNLSSRASK